MPFTASFATVLDLEQRPWYSSSSIKTCNWKMFYICLLPLKMNENPAPPSLRVYSCSAIYFVLWSGRFCALVKRFGIRAEQEKVEWCLTLLSQSNFLAISDTKCTHHLAFLCGELVNDCKMRMFSFIRW